MSDIVTPVFVIQVLCMAVAFFTFNKLISSNVYVQSHRLLPTIVAVITIFDFYQVIIPFLPAPNQQEFCRVLSNMCAVVTLFMMLLYVYSLSTTRVKPFITYLTIATMIIISAIKFGCYAMGVTIGFNLDLYLSIFLIVIGVLVLGIKRERVLYKKEINLVKIMFLLYLVAVGGYLFRALVWQNCFVMTVVFTIDNIVFYYMAMTNNIEDISSILSSKMFDLIEYPVFLVNKEFYLVGANEYCKKRFPRGAGAEFAFEGGSFDNKYLFGQRMIENNENDKDSYADGCWYRIHWTVVSEKKSVKGYIFTITDVSEQHQKMQEAKMEVAEKSQFLAKMSHELRSPLHAMIGASEILLGKPDISTKNRGLIQHIEKAADGLLDLVGEILDFSKLEAGKFQFSEKKYCIDDIFDELAYSNILNIGSKPVDFSIAITSDYPKVLLGDALRVREVFQNVLNNAVKHTQSGSIRAEISFEVVEEKAHISFTITDTGDGMSPALIEKIFSEYVSDADGEIIEGTGLGLSITRQIVSLLGGSISASSDGISGSTFTGDFYQKIADAQLQKPTVFNQRTVSRQANYYRYQYDRPDVIYPGARILVADDMKINQEILSQLLATFKCQVDCYSDGAQAVAACSKADYQLILLDQMMAPMNGIEAAKKIKKITNAPIILVTANTEDNVANIVADTKAIDDFMGKPLHSTDIKKILSKYISKEYAQSNYSENKYSSIAKRDLHNLEVYHKTLETFVKEMQPLLLHLPKYAVDDKELFKVKVHGIKGVSRQIGRETFSDQAEIMEMAAKSEHWSYIEKHLDEFLTALCDTVEEVTKELTQIAPDINEAEILVEAEETHKSVDLINLKTVFEEILEAFDNFDIAQIETGLDILEDLELHGDELTVFSKIIDASDELEYERGSEILREYLDNH